LTILLEFELSRTTHVLTAVSAMLSFPESRSAVQLYPCEHAFAVLDPDAEPVVVWTCPKNVNVSVLSTVFISH
jgi:hypothetical protein